MIKKVIFAICFFICMIPSVRAIQYLSDGTIQKKRITVKEVDRYQTKIDGFSGLVYNKEQEGFLAVSDFGRIYEIDFEGNIKSTLYKKGGDLEGITINPKSGDIYVVEERTMKVYKFNNVEKKLKEYLKIRIPFGKRNRGLEGVTYGQDTLYIANQLAPSKIFKHAVKSGVLIDIDINYAGYLSDLNYDYIDDTLWIVDAKKRKVYKSNLKGKLLLTIDIPMVVKPEALVMDITKRILWIGCDETGILHKLELIYE